MAAMYEGLKKNKMFGYVAVPKDGKPIEWKWVFRWKVNGEEEVVRAKVKLAARVSVRYQESTTMKHSVQRPSLLQDSPWRSLSYDDLDLFHFDNQQAFVQSDLNEKPCMRFPPGCGNASGTTVRLRRSFYELKQSRRQWNSLLVPILQGYSFEQCAAESCVFRLMRQNQVVFIMSFEVDAIGMTGKENNCNELYKYIFE